MTKKEALANMYITLRKEFDGDEFKSGISMNQVSYLVRNFKVNDLEDKITYVKNAIEEKKKRLQVEAWFETESGKRYKKHIESQLEKYHSEYKNIHDSFQNWIIEEINKMVSGGWTANVYIGNYNGNVEIGLVNRDSKDKFRTMQFGHELTIYYDKSSFRSSEPEINVNYGSLGSFNPMTNETRGVYLKGLATIVNNKEWLTTLMEKFNDNIAKIYDLFEIERELKNKLTNPDMSYNYEE